MITPKNKYSTSVNRTKLYRIEPTWHKEQLSPENNNFLASARISLTYKILATNKIGIQSTSIGKTGKNELKRLALTKRGKTSNDRRMTKTSIAVKIIYAIDKFKLNSMFGYW